MSGPKVVRVVTREERVATCAALLRRLDQTIATWIQEAERFGSDDTAISAVRAKRQELAAVLDADRFDELVKLANSEQAYLIKDVETRQERAVQVAAIARQRARDQRGTAKTLLHELKSKGVSDAALLSSLTEVAAGVASAEQVQAVLAAGFARLERSTAGPGVTEAQRELAKRLALPEDTSANVPRATAKTGELSRLVDLDKRLAEFETVMGEVAVHDFASRAKAIEESSEASQNLKIDSLVIDIAMALRDGRARQQVRTTAQEVLAEMEAAGVSDGSALALAYKELRGAVASSATSDLSEQVLAGQTALDAHVKKRNSDARRVAILTGLASLGYEVHEGMATAWAKDGRVVVERPNLPGYGVEVAADPDATRLQVRAVSLEANRDTRRDSDVETLWCGDFGKLQGLLAAQGGGIEIERALPVGAVPLKVVAAPTSVTQSRSAPNQRAN